MCRLQTNTHFRPCPQTNTHFESGLGVAIQGQMPPGPATLLRIGGRRLERLWVEEGEVSEALDLWSPHLCRTQVGMGARLGLVRCVANLKCRSGGWNIKVEPIIRNHVI